MSCKRVLIVDDEKPIRILLNQILHTEGHNCSLAADSTEAREHLKSQNYDLILCDNNMPKETGLEFLKAISPKYKDTASIMVTAIDDPMIAKIAIEIGCYDYITKPVERNRVLIGVTSALHRRELEITNRDYRNNLKQMVKERTLKLRKALDGIIQTIALTVETRDPYTAGHQTRVAKIASAIAKEMRLEENQIEGVHIAGIIHDLGKISVPAEILSKPSRLTETEFSLIKEHPQVGYNIMKNIEFPWAIAKMVLQHHERLDGSGYPSGLTGDEILKEAKIIGVADVVEAMASHRPYRPALGIEPAIREIKKNRGVLYDPEVVDACLNVFSEKKFNFDAMP